MRLKAQYLTCGALVGLLGGCGNLQPVDPYAFAAVRSSLPGAYEALVPRPINYNAPAPHTTGFGGSGNVRTCRSTFSGAVRCVDGY